ncbi:MAG: T9SS type A sorting domain-containing protein [Lewinellaceae bacterium]|nr:T9SS type A sorting domain-containing protein [Lewinellaceae bacterium]
MERRNLLKIGTLSALFPFLPHFSAANTCDPTTEDIQGPFYSPNAPVRNKISPEGAVGTVLFLTGTIYYNDCETPIPMANLDVWQADDGGAYDNVGYNFRGKFDTDPMGNYAMETVLPGKYLNGSAFRPRHIHFKIAAAGGGTLTTQLYFEGDTDIAGDPWASDDSAEGRIIPLTEDADGNLHGVFDVSLDIVPVINSNTDINLDAGTRILNISPNPMTDSGQVRVTIVEKTNLSLDIFSINGRKVRNIHQGTVPAGIQAFELDHLSKEGIKLSAGIYIIQLMANNILVDAKRFMIL